MSDQHSPSIEETFISPDTIQSDLNDELSTNRASFIALAIHASLAMMVVAIVVLADASYISLSNRIAISFFLAGCCLAEFGSYIFLTHCMFLLPSNSSASIRVPVVSNVITISQFAIFERVPNLSDETHIGFLFAYFVGLWISGWRLHRIFGASLSLRGQDVYQEAITTKVLLAAAPLLLLMGLIPTLVMMSDSTVLATDFASNVVIAALILLVVTVVPILSIYLCFGYLRLQHQGLWSTLLIVAISIVILLAFLDGPNMVSLFLLCTIICFAGIIIAIAPFYCYGFRPVWAKRKRVEKAERAVSFDEVS